MRVSPLATIAVVALLVVAGCSGLSVTDETQPSTEVPSGDFPNASAIDQSVFDTHTRVLADTSFALTIERTEKKSNPRAETNFTYRNETSRFRVAPGASRYLVRTNATGEDSLLVNGSVYSDGNTTYQLSREDGETDVTTRDDTLPVFDESSDQYLWQLWFGTGAGRLERPAINATFQREGVETFQGVPVMRYEATGVDALSDTRLWDEDASEQFESFSATLLLDEDGVIRHYEYELVLPVVENRPRRIAASYTLTDVGRTDVEEPEWVANATAGS